jgi:hypothetical protein
MTEARIRNLECRVATLESRVKYLTEENERLKKLNRMLKGAPKRQGAPNKFVNTLDLIGTVPRVLDKSYSVPLLVKQERKKLQEFLGDIADGSLENAIYKLHKRICTEMVRPASSDELEELLRDLLQSPQ